MSVQRKRDFTVDTTKQISRAVILFDIEELRVMVKSEVNVTVETRHYRQASVQSPNNLRQPYEVRPLSGRQDIAPEQPAKL